MTNPGTRNPYAPPTAPVADVRFVDPRGPRPASVSWAVGLLWIHWAVSTGHAAWLWQQLAAPLSSRMGLGLVYAGLLGFLVSLIYPIARGKNWARLLALAWMALNLLLSAVDNIPETPPTGHLSEVETALYGAALCLIFFTPGREWFQRRPA